MSRIQVARCLELSLGINSTQIAKWAQEVGENMCSADVRPRV